MTEQDNEYMLPSGDVARLEIPDMYTILSQVGIGSIPDPLTSAVLKLLELEGVSLPTNSVSTLQLMAEKQRGMFGIYAWCRVDKKVDLSLKRGDGTTTLGRLDIPPIDMEYVYYNFFRARNARKLSSYQSTDTANVNGTETATPDMHQLRDNPQQVFEDS